MKAKCVNGLLQENGKVRYTMVSVDNDLVKVQPVESNVFYLENVNLVIGKNYDITVQFQEIVPQ